ncbi:MAG: hypothetical protein JO008_07785 [Alphaproteobacteria bacterium]|nr:hypothetical protein [Alphaproteobacteria bacterium]
MPVVTRPWVLACSLLTIAALSAQAIELPSGTKNFSPPNSTPNYFSNEVGTVQGRGGGQRAAEAPRPQPNIVYHSGGRQVKMTVRGSHLVVARGKPRGRTAAKAHRRGGKAVAVAHRGHGSRKRGGGRSAHR